ncbi:sulfate transporter, partial [Trifolium medium]|nr:sulfate transporter [Trifolium medium]
MRNYRTSLEDVQWARNGMVATIINGEVVPVVHNRITDAGFNDLDIIPMGADKVLVQSLSGSDVASVMESAREFFSLLFSNWVRWDNDVVPFQR